MFTNEFKEKSTVTTILDEKSFYEDLIVEISDDKVILKQFNDTLFDDIPDYITIDMNMLKDLIYAMNKPEGFFKAV